MDIKVGDKVQIKNSAIDITNGVSATSGKMYVEGSPMWATVDLIDNSYYTGGRWGLPTTVTKIRCTSNDGVVVWQVQPGDIASNVIKSDEPVQTVASPVKITLLTEEETTSSTSTTTSKSPSLTPYVTTTKSETWASGITTSGTNSGKVNANNDTITTQTGIDSALDIPESFDYSDVRGTFRNLNSQEIKSIGNPKGLLIDESAIRGAKFNTVWQNPNKRIQLQNEDVENIVNENQFPKKASNANGLIPARYDYQIQVGDTRYPMMVSLEDKLMEARAALGIPVHGKNDIARAMKYYMYNRFKTPDTNLAHNKSFTYVFFTRPDLNLLNYMGGANNQVKNHSEAAMLWRRNPDLFKLLTDYKRCRDSNNFNLLLSSQVTSFDIQDEQLSTVEAGRSWANYEMIYGDEYSGRAAGEFSCNFTETADYSIINLLKLWITYIYNVRRGAWSPSYNLFGTNGGVSLTPNASHVYTKTLDYAASAYVFKCGPDGDDVLYWSKYYGVIPINTGANALSWELGTPVGDTPKLNIRFRYSFKRDLSPISLLEFNSVANIDSASEAVYENSFNGNYAHSSRPFVGAPFIEMKFEDPKPLRADGGVNTGPNAPNSSIRLKFRPTGDSKLTDQVLYRSSLSNR
jgi:hypothetical protein